MRRIAITVVALALAAGCVGDDDGPEASFDATLLAYDADIPLDATTSVAATDPVVIERVEFTTFDDTRLPGTFSIEPGADNGPCLIIQHGSGGTQRQGQELGAGLRIGGLQLSVLSIEGRLHGERAPGGVTEPVVDVETWAEVVRDTAIDLRRGIDYLETRPECDPDRIGLFGISMGGFLGVLTAAVDERIAAVVLLATGADYELLIKQATFLFPEVDRDDPAAIDAALEVLDPIDPKHYVGAIAPRPLLMLNGEEDPVVPRPVARQLHDFAGANSEIEWFSGRHVPDRSENVEYSDDLVEFLTEELIDR